LKTRLHKVGYTVLGLLKAADTKGSVNCVNSCKLKIKLINFLNNRMHCTKLGFMESELLSRSAHCAVLGFYKIIVIMITIQKQNHLCGCDILISKSKSEIIF